MQNNGLFSTSDFQQAIFLRYAGVIYVSTSWDGRRAVFHFKKPPDDVLAAWQRGDDRGVRAILDAADFFRDELHRPRSDA